MQKSIDFSFLNKKVKKLSKICYIIIVEGEYMKKINKIKNKKPIKNTKITTYR